MKTIIPVETLGEMPQIPCVRGDDAEAEGLDRGKTSQTNDCQSALTGDASVEGVPSPLAAKISAVPQNPNWRIGIRQESAAS